MSSISTSTEMLPCPFCGGPPELQHWKVNAYEKWAADTDSDYWWSVFCKECFSEGPEELSEEAAIAGWNRRVT